MLYKHNIPNQQSKAKLLFRQYFFKEHTNLIADHKHDCFNIRGIGTCSVPAVFKSLVLYFLKKEKSIFFFEEHRRLYVGPSELVNSRTTTILED